MKFDVTGTSGTAGSITISGTGPSTESNPADNKATISLASGSGGGSGAGGGLPITGPSSSVVPYGVGAVLAGLALVLFGRRRRSQA